jgi:hypothetical protein
MRAQTRDCASARGSGGCVNPQSQSFSQGNIYALPKIMKQCISVPAEQIIPIDGNTLCMQKGGANATPACRLES